MCLFIVTKKKNKIKIKIKSRKIDKRKRKMLVFKAFHNTMQMSDGAATSFKIKMGPL